MNTPHTPRRGFTIVELMIVVAIIGLLMTLLLPAVSSALRNAHAVQDKVVLKGLGDALMTSSEDYDTRFIRPSLVARCHVVKRGKDHGYVPGQGLEGKPWDSTENLYSTMIMKEYIGPENCISPVDSNPHAGVKGQVEEASGDVLPYDYTAWDPGNDANVVQNSPEGYMDTTFSCELNDENPDHGSWATQLLAGNRYRLWEDNPSSEEHALLSTRTVTDSGDSAAWPSELTDGITNTSEDGYKFSPVLDQLGATNQWQGHVYTSQGTVEMKESHLEYKFHASGIEDSGSYAKAVPDNMFECEFTNSWSPDGLEGMTSGFGNSDNFLCFTNNGNVSGSYSTNDKFCLGEGNASGCPHSTPTSWKYLNDSVFLKAHLTFDYTDE
ncbi:MAG: type II secretion system protein [Phycisphaerales bacterium]|jgi:prepilin-type N-terminal cleavage/methylation domain-containing protein|nr:type II secretion system protein [Phycisphaerales bacterium]